MKDSKPEYRIRTMKEGEISQEVTLFGEIFDIVFVTSQGNFNIRIKDDALQVSTDYAMSIEPEAANGVTLKSINTFEVEIEN